MIAKEIKPGTVVQLVVGYPGPDCDMALVTDCYGPGHHKIRYKIYGHGEWNEDETRAELYDDPPYRDQWDDDMAKMLLEEWRRISVGA